MRQQFKCYYSSDWFLITIVCADTQLAEANKNLTRTKHWCVAAVLHAWPNACGKRAMLDIAALCYEWLLL